MWPFNVFKKIFIHLTYFLFSDSKIYRWMIGGRWEKWRYFYFSHVGTKWINVPMDSIQDGPRPLPKCVGNKALKKECYGAAVIRLKKPE